MPFSCFHYYLLPLAERVKDFFKVYIFANLETKNEILQDMKDRWQEQTGGNALFISALESTNIDELRQTILEKVRELYRLRFPYKTDFFY